MLEIPNPDSPCPTSMQILRIEYFSGPEKAIFEPTCFHNVITELNSPKKPKIMPSARFELTISSLLVRCLTNLAIKANDDPGEDRTHDLKINSLTP